MPKLIPNQYVASLTPYQPGLPIEALARRSGLPPEAVIKLASNENPFGMGPRARAALRRAEAGAHRYPDQHELTTALAAHHGLTPEHVVIGNGSNDVLDLVARTFLAPGTDAVSSQYAFAVYPIATQSAGARNVIVPAAPDLGHDLPAMRAAVTTATRVLWLANPNNPTGTFIPYDQLKSFLKTVPPQVIVVLDEAYYEYISEAARPNTATWLRDHPNLIITRTFSKVHGLAGLRVGYALAHPDVAGLMNRVRQPFNASSIALAAATAALADQAYVRRSAGRNRRGLRQLEAGLARLHVTFIPSAGNFVTIRVANAAAVYDQLLARGIIVRPLAGYGLPDHLRISVGRPSENTRFLEGMHQILQGLK